MKPKAQKPYDCEAEIKKLPAEFWLGAPTAKHIPCAADEFVNPKATLNKRHYSAEAWEILKNVGHKLFPRLCKKKEVYFFIERDNHGNKTFAVYKLPDGSLCKRRCIHLDGNGSETEVYTGSTIESRCINLEYTSNPDDNAVQENHKKQIKKLENLWNKLRKKALRDAKQEPGAKVAKKKAQDTKSKRQEKQIQHILEIALATKKELNSYIKQLQQGKITNKAIAAMYKQMIDLSAAGKAYKQITGVTKKNKRVT